MEPLLGAADGSEGGGGVPDGRGGVRRRGEARIDAAGVQQHDVDAAPRRRASSVALVAGLAVAALCALGWSAAFSVNVEANTGLQTAAATASVPSTARPLHGEMDTRAECGLRLGCGS
jgi:hypothetical protein